MAQTKVLAWERVWYSERAVQFAVLAGAVIVAPFLASQWITGILVNAALFLTTALLGVRAGLFLSVIPSGVALVAGTLPVPLAPMIPFIIGGNMLLVSVFGVFFRKNYWAGVISGSVVKFIFLLVSGYIVVERLAEKAFALPFASMMSWPQLATAFLGGVVAYGGLRILHKHKEE